MFEWTPEVDELRRRQYFQKSIHDAINDRSGQGNIFLRTLAHNDPDDPNFTTRASAMPGGSQWPEYYKVLQLHAQARGKNFGGMNPVGMNRKQNAGRALYEQGGEHDWESLEGPMIGLRNQFKR